MIAPHNLPDHYAEWNDRLGAPFGGMFAWQTNNRSREFEYPWAYHQIREAGERLRIVEIGGGLSGLQFALAREGHSVINVDPGLQAKGRGFALDADRHDALCEQYDAPVRLASTTIAEAGIEDRSVDVLLSVSTIEHFADQDLHELAGEIPRVLNSSGIVILTIDLFLDVAPFVRAERNSYGRNINVPELLDRSGLELAKGRPEELHGSAEFDPETVQTNSGAYFIGSYPALIQCVVARRKPGSHEFFRPSL